MKRPTTPLTTPHTATWCCAALLTTCALGAANLWSGPTIIGFLRPASPTAVVTADQRPSEQTLQAIAALTTIVGAIDHAAVTGKPAPTLATSDIALTSAVTAQLGHLHTYGTHLRNYATQTGTPALTGCTVNHDTIALIGHQRHTEIVEFDIVFKRHQKTQHPTPYGANTTNTTTPPSSWVSRSPFRIHYDVENHTIMRLDILDPTTRATLNLPPIPALPSSATPTPH